MGHRHDWIENVRHRLWPLVDEPFERMLGFGAEGVTPEDQLVGTIPIDPEAVEKLLHELGFARNPIAYLKRKASGDVSAGSWAYRESMFARWQLHVTLYGIDATETAVYAHWEYNWHRHPIRHLREEDFSAEKGVAKMRAILDEADVEYSTPV